MKNDNYKPVVKELAKVKIGNKGLAKVKKKA